MRTNLPVTQREYSFPLGYTLVSTTDTKGRILYCNPLFIEVSGYNKYELLGQPHNILRHPSMPEEAFRDLWNTIQAGRPWSGLIKNRRKDGDYYWVMANVTPLVANNEIVGYMSVRTKADTAQTDKAEILYKSLWQEKEANRQKTKLDGGNVRRITMFGRLKSLLQLGSSSKLLLLCATAVVASQAASLLLFSNETAFPLENVIVQCIIIAAVWFAIRQLNIQPIKQLVQVSNRMAGGDLTQHITRSHQGHTGDLELALAQLNVNIQSIVRDAREQSQQMVDDVRSMVTSNHDLMARTERQAESLNRTSRSLEEMVELISTTASVVAEAEKLSSKTVNTTNMAQNAVSEVAETMKLINRASDEISSISQIIDSIGFQTNILALNAAVEAARADQHGAGFAVVAGEVQALAHRTSAAARNIGELIETSAQQIQAGLNQTNNAMKTMQAVRDDMTSMDALIHKIGNTASREQEHIGNVSTNVANLAEITTKNQELSFTLSDAAESLESLAENVSETVRVFRVDASHHEIPNAVELRKRAKVNEH